MQSSIACTISRPTGGIKEADDQREARLWAYLGRLVREADARIAAGQPRHSVGLASGHLVGADQRCVCGQPADQCRCKDPYRRGRAVVGRPARHTFHEMPGYERQPVPGLRRPLMADGPCPLCERWTCDPSKCPPASAAPAPAAVTASATRTGPGITAPSALGQGLALGVSA